MLFTGRQVLRGGTGYVSDHLGLLARLNCLVPEEAKLPQDAVTYVLRSATMRVASRDLATQNRTVSTRT